MQARLHQLGALLQAAVDQLANFVELHARIDRADVGVLVERIADAQRGDAIAQLADHLREDAFLHEQTRAGAADVPLVEIDAGDDAFDRLIERRVFENDVRRLAAELERELLLRAGDGLREHFADSGRAGEGELVDVVMIDERLAGRARAADDVHDAVGQLGLLEDLRQMHRA